MRVLVGCEESGAVRDAFIRRGHDAISCDLLPTSSPGPHYQGDVFDIIDDGWDMAIFFPPCTHLAVSGAAWFKEKRADGRQQNAIQFVQSLMDANIPRIAIENPVGVLSTYIRKPDQIIEPYQFGHNATKKTCLWLKNMPLLLPTNIVDKGEFVTFPSGKRMGKWYADSFRMPPKERAMFRSKTFLGIAEAMADQWGSIELS